MISDAILQPTPPAPPSSSPAPDPATKICLVILFNHRYDQNLPKLERIYRDRFQHIRYLVPFYRGNRPDVYPVYYSSFQFEGFFRTAWEHLREEGFTHFLFLADDMILNPRLHEASVCTRLHVGAGDGYIKYIYPLTNAGVQWFPFMSSLVAIAGKSGVNWASELPDYSVAEANLRDKGFPMGRLGLHNVRHGCLPKAFFQSFFYFALRFNKRRKVPGTDLLALPYPLLHGNSDILIIPAAQMERFCTYCSVFAAMSVFVEVGAPTALALSCPRVVTEADTGMKSIEWWSSEAKLDAFCRRFDYRLDRLLAEFEEDMICLHPIKLSKWRFSDE